MTTFVLVGLLGLGLLGLSLVLGDVFGGFFDALAGDVFSSAVVGGFVSAFGFGAAIADSSGAPLVVSLPVGLGAGVVFAWFAAWLTRLVRDGGSDGTPEADDVLGREGSVVSEIPAEGYGTVRVLVGGHVVRLNARAEVGVPAGTPVHVTGVLSPTAVTAFQIQDVTDDGSYLADLGRPEAARIGQAASIAEANARQAAEQARIKAEEEIAVAQRALALKQAEIKAETDAASANAAAAGPLAQADRDQSILLEQEKVAVRQAALTERKLETEVRKPADAARYKVEQEAEGNRAAEIAAAEGRKAASIANAQAKAEEARLNGEAEKSRRTALAEAEAIEGHKRGEAERARRVAEAEATRAEGEALAASTLAVGQAEAEAMDKRAEAFAHYNDAAVLQMLIEVLPQIAKEVAAPIAAIDQLTVISTDGAGALPKQVTDNVVQTLSMLKTSTGLDLEALIKRTVDGAVGGTSLAPAAGGNGATAR